MIKKIKSKYIPLHVSILMILATIAHSPKLCYAQSGTWEALIIDSIPLAQEELYSRAKTFVAYNFVDSKNVIQMDDKDVGKIICKGTMNPTSRGALGMNYQNNFDFTLTIDLRDNKYRAVLNNIYHSGLGPHKTYPGGHIENEKPDCGTLMIPKKDWIKMQEAVKLEATKFMNKLKNHMNASLSKDDF